MNRAWTLILGYVKVELLWVHEGSGVLLCVPASLLPYRRTNVQSSIVSLLIKTLFSDHRNESVSSLNETSLHIQSRAIPTSFA